MLLGDPTPAIWSKGNTPKFRWGRCSQQKTCNTSETELLWILQAGYASHRPNNSVNWDETDNSTLSVLIRNKQTKGLQCAHILTVNRAAFLGSLRGSDPCMKWLKPSRNPKKKQLVEAFTSTFCDRISAYFFVGELRRLWPLTTPLEIWQMQRWCSILKHVTSDKVHATEYLTAFVVCLQSLSTIHTERHDGIIGCTNSAFSRVNRAHFSMHCVSPDHFLRGLLLAPSCTIRSRVIFYDF